MAVALEQFVKQLTDSGVIAPGKLENFIPPKAAPKDAQELARQLVQSKHLTKFQAQEIYGGRAKSLILGNYTLLDKIGAGGMGQVFKAEHRRMHRLVAIKMLPAAMTKDAAAVARFQREVEAAAKLRHPHVVATDDADEANGVHFLVMEYAEGSDLSALVKKNGPLPVAKAVNYILQAARGLEYAHKHGVVHRDIKPANLLLNSEGTVKILDMGLARIEGGGDTATQAELTGTGAVLGTVDYMAPEQALSTKHVDGRADIYSLGCALYYLITAHATYDGDSLMAKLLAHREQPIPSLGADVPEEVQAVFEKMVAKKVGDRYQSMSDVVAALEQCSSGQQTSVSIQQSVDTNLDADVLTFLRDTPPHASHVQKKAKKAVPIKTASKVASSKSGKDNKKLIMGASGAGFLGLVILAAVIFKLRTKDGTLVVEVSQPDATVQVLDANGKVEISQPGGKGTVSTSVDPGKHRLKVEKEGFNFFAKDFEMDSGGEQSIKAALIPLNDKQLAAGSTKPLAFKSPGFDQWMNTVTALPADKQMEAVAKKLQELNPRFDGKETHKIEGGVVTEVEFATDNLTDISPVRALAGLKRLTCHGSEPGKGILSDLLPLKGMPLTQLDCGGTKVTDLSPLAGMPLTNLACGVTPVSDLSPLKGMKLTRLDVSETQVADLTALKGMPLTWFECNYTPVFNLSPLAGMPLTNLSCFFTRISDLSPLKGMKLKFLHLDHTSVFDLRPLEGMPLMELHCQHTRVSDLSPLEGLKLRFLNCGDSLTSDLSPLKGMPLKALYCGESQVADLSALRGMQLTFLACNDNLVSDLSSLEEMNLTEVYLTPKHITQRLDILRRMKSLNTIGIDGANKFPPAEFWKKYDAGVFGKPASTTVNSDRKPITNINDPAFRQWMKTVAALPAEQQVDAVVKKLRELNPGFDGKESHTMDGGAVTGLDVATDEVIDLSPVRALVRLKYLRFTGGPTRTGKLADLSPMQGLPLTDLILDANKQLSDLSSLRGMPLTRLSLEETSVTDLTPLKGMKLADFNADLTPLVDISLLAGMPLKKLTLSHSRVSDLSPLRGMKLAVLTIGGTQVTDLSALKGMPIETLFCHESSISDLSPLKGMQIAKLTCHTTKVSDLTPLRGMPLVHLLIDKSPVADLSPLEGMNLTVFVFTPKDVTKGIEVLRRMKSVQNIGVRWDIVFPPNEFWKKYDAGEFGKPDSTVANPDRKPITNINDPAFQQWMKSVAALPAEEQVKAVAKKLQELNPEFDGQVAGAEWAVAPKIENGVVTEFGFATNNVIDISPVRALTGLKTLRCAGRDGKGILSDLRPVEGMQLTTLICGNFRLSDLSPLKGLPLTKLWCNSSDLSDLSPLQGMPMKDLRFGGSQVSDLSPLTGMPLEVLYICDTRVSDLLSLDGLKLTEFVFTPKNIAKGMEAIRKMKSLTTIGVDWNTKFPPEEFWKKYDAGEFNK